MHRTSCRSSYPRGSGELNPSSHSWIFTSVSADSSACSCLFTSATVRIPCYTVPRCGIACARLSDSTVGTWIKKQSENKTRATCERRQHPRVFRITSYWSTARLSDDPLSRLAQRSFAPLQKSRQKSPFFCVNRRPIWYGFLHQHKSYAV